MRRIVEIFAITIVAFAVLACQRSESSATASQQRIVALSPAVAIILRELGREQAIVGRHGFDLVLNPNLPVCGDQTGINYERLLALNPSHIVTEWGLGGPPEQLKKLSEQRGWRLHDSTLRTPNDIVREVAALGTFVGVENENVAKILNCIESAWTRDDALASKGRVLLLADIAQPAALGPGSFHYDILGRIGVTHAIEDGGPYQHLPLERIATIDPDVIVMVLPRAPMEPTRELSDVELIRALGRIGELDIAAVRNRRVLLIDDPGALTPSTAMIGFTERIKTYLRSIE